MVCRVATTISISALSPAMCGPAGITGKGLLGCISLSSGVTSVCTSGLRCSLYSFPPFMFLPLAESSPT